MREHVQNRLHAKDSEHIIDALIDYQTTDDAHLHETIYAASTCKACGCAESL